MKKITILGIILLALFYTACDDSLLSSKLIVNGNYYPLSVGNWWKYHNENFINSELDSIHVEIECTVEENENTWYQFIRNDSVFFGRYRYVEGDLFVGKKLLLKKNIIKGDTWNYEYVINNNVMRTTMRVADVGIKRVVFGKTYDNVVKISHHTINTSEPNDSDIYINDYYYAEGIGWIQSVSQYGILSLINYHLEEE